jgi:hypothetical protein
MTPFEIRVKAFTLVSASGLVALGTVKKIAPLRAGTVVEILLIKLAQFEATEVAIVVKIVKYFDDIGSGCKIRHCISPLVFCIILNMGTVLSILGDIDVYFSTRIPRRDLFV